MKRPRKETQRHKEKLAEGDRRGEGQGDRKEGSGVPLPHPGQAGSSRWPPRAMANGMIAWRGGRQRVTNEPAESPALVMNGLGGVWRGGSGVGGSHQDKYFLLLEPGQAGGGPGDWGGVSMKGLGGG